MNRFIIVDGLPYLYAEGKTYTVRWDSKGFTVGPKVKIKIPKDTYSELSVKAKCKALNSISAHEKQAGDNDT